jgi:hypothetical protein
MCPKTGDRDAKSHLIRLRLRSDKIGRRTTNLIIFVPALRIHGAINTVTDAASPILGAQNHKPWIPLSLNNARHMTASLLPPILPGLSVVVA